MELIDLIKAYELCRLELVWIVAVNTKFPLHVLRMEVESYLGTRRLVMKKTVSDVSQPKIGVRQCRTALE